MGSSKSSSIPLSHATILSLLLLALASCILSATALSHSLPYSAAAPPQHQHQAPSPAPSPLHHHHLHHSFSPSSSPTHYPSKPPTSPAKPSTHPPAYLPVKPPTKAPTPAPHTKPYTKPPTKAPTPYTKPPTKAPVPYTKPPTKAPVPYTKPPTKAPVPYTKPPTKSPYSKPPRKLVAVEGVVYCKNCSYAGVDTLLGASPLSGARVELRCRNTKYMIKKTATTDKNGFFFLQAPKYITTYGAHKCLVFLIKTHNITTGGPCSHATNLNGGVSGAFLFLDKKLAPPSPPLPFSLFTVGPFAFEPPKCHKQH